MELNRAFKKIYDYGVLVMFSHTIFSFSFALLSMLLAANGLPSVRITVWIIIAFLGARTGANAINRAIDAEIDAKNPRTASRQLPQGLMKKKEVIIFSTVCFAVMVFSAYMLNTLCLILSPVALFLLIIYSYTKRFTWACHIILGITSAGAPVGAWIAVRGSISWLALFLGAANALWVSGFDIIYGAQDYKFDKENGICSIPAYFGVKNALYISSLFHFITVILLILVGYMSQSLGIIFYVGVGFIAILLLIEHRMISPNNLTNAKIASYNINQLISIVFLTFSIIDIFI